MKSLPHALWALFHCLYEIVTIVLLIWGYYSGRDIRWLLVIGVLHLGACTSSSYHGIRAQMEE